VFTNKKREGISTFVCAISIYVVETPKASINEHKLPLPIISFGVVAYAFVGQPFLKQLYIQLYSLSLKGKLYKMDGAYKGDSWFCMSH